MYFPVYNGKTEPKGKQGDIRRKPWTPSGLCGFKAHTSSLLFTQQTQFYLSTGAVSGFGQGTCHSEPTDDAALC